MKTYQSFQCEGNERMILKVYPTFVRRCVDFLEPAGWTQRYPTITYTEKIVQRWGFFSLDNFVECAVRQARMTEMK